MKKNILLLTTSIALITGSASAQNSQIQYPQQSTAKSPQPLSNYQDYQQQGADNYQNNAEWYNKDNVTDQGFQSPAGNYISPGNSNPQNSSLYQPEIKPGLPERSVDLAPSSRTFSSDEMILR